jgi:hypothetical protein
VHRKRIKMEKLTSAGLELRSFCSTKNIFIRGSRFLDFWIFNILQLVIDWHNNSKTQVEKVFFFIFMSSYAEMSFAREKITKYGP